MKTILAILSLFQSAPVTAGVGWCSPNVDSNQQVRRVDDVLLTQPLARSHEYAMRLLSGRHFLKLSGQQLRRISGIVINNNYRYYLVEAAIQANPNSDLDERRSLLELSSKIALFDSSSGTFNLHIAQMLRGTSTYFVQPLVVGIRGRIRQYSLFCHSAE
jgi:hypothetical protein